MDCLYENDIAAGVIREGAEGIASGNIHIENHMDMDNKQHVFLPYQSPYSGGFPLKDTFVIPRPCAAISLNMTVANYRFGLKDLVYDLGKAQGATNAFRKLDKPYLLHQNGTAVSKWLGELDQAEEIIYIRA